MKKIQKWKRLPKAQLIIADPPYNIGKSAYGFEIKKDFFKAAQDKVLNRPVQPGLF